MELLIFVVITVVLLSILVLFLHRYQVAESLDSADKGAPLPPLGEESLGTTSSLTEDLNSPASTHIAKDQYNSNTSTIAEEEDPLAMLIESQSKTADTTEISPGPTTANETPPPSDPEQVTLPPHKANPSQVNDQNPHANESNTPVNGSSNGGTNWLDQVSRLKKSGNLDAALSACEKHYPLMSALQQASLIHRARIKDLIREGQPTDKALTSLYLLAAQASFLHDPGDGLPNLSAPSLKKLNLNDIISLDMPYHELGYEHLKLLKKTDILQLKTLWGEPQTHALPREFHREAWISLTDSQQSKLF